MALLNVLESQRNSVLAMLELQVPTSREGTVNSVKTAPSWKVLVYDKTGQQILATLMKVGSLRQHGVTLHLQLGSERGPVPEVPAVYFIEATEENLARVAKDLSWRGGDSGDLPLYRQFHINFISPISTAQLERLARSAAASESHTLVASVVDRYIDFVTLDASTFHLSIPGALKVLMSAKSSDELIEQTIENVVTKLQCVCHQLEIIPIIKCPANTGSSPACMIGKRLCNRFQSLLQKQAISPSRKPVTLVLLDRTTDIVSMIGHTWSYRSLLHDLFGLHLNRVTVPIADTAAPDSPPRPQLFDLDESDSIWRDHKSSPFPEVANAIAVALQTFTEESKKLAPQDSSSEISDVQSALSALPEMTERKRVLDKHTNLATAVVADVRERELDRYFEAEEAICSNSVSKEKALSDLKLFKKGTREDKLRLAVCLALQKKLTEQNLNELKQWLLINGVDQRALEGVLRLRSMVEMDLPNAPSASSTKTSGLAQNAARFLGETVLEQSRALAMQGIKQLIPLSRTLPVVAKAERWLTGRNSEEWQSLDPRGADASLQNSLLIHSSIVFVVGGGCYTESVALQTFEGHHILYGSTYFERPTEFVDDLIQL